MVREDLASVEPMAVEPARLAGLSRYTRWILPIVLLVEIVLVTTGVLGFGDGVVVLIVVEATVFLVVVAELLAMRRAVKRARARGQTLFQAVSAALDHILPGWAARLVRHDLLMWRALWLAVRGRRDVAEDGDVVHYSAQLRPMFWVFFFLNMFEIALVELALPWPTVQLVLLVLGILSAVWFLALITTLYKYPHTIDPRVLRVRFSAFYDHSVPVAKVESVRLARRTWPVKRSCEVVDGVLVMEMQKSTNILVLLSEPHRMDLGKHGVQEVTEVALWADDPRAAVELIKRRGPGTSHSGRRPDGQA